MMRECSTYKPSTSQVRFLLRWTGGELEEAGEGATCYQLLRAILGRKIVVPEVYDVMNKVQVRTTTLCRMQLKHTPNAKTSSYN